MDRAFLEQLGFDVSDAGGEIEASLLLGSWQAVNPLTRQPIGRVYFSVMDERLSYVGPPEFVGAQPINLAFLTPASRLEDLILQTFNDHLFQLERRSNELTALGLSPRVDPQTLQLTSEIERTPLTFTIAASRVGQFHISKILNNGVPVESAAMQSAFELSEFFDRRALEDFLFALCSDVVPMEERPQPVGPATIKSTPSMLAASANQSTLAFKQLFGAFGEALVPPRSPLEVIADVRVGSQQLRFAAARVQGKTFRGLLAGPSGKIWADRFELDEFPGIKGFISELMKVPYDDVEVSP